VTKPSEFPLRPHGHPWPGLKDAENRLMVRGGEMSDCTNVIINTADVLQKRKGFIRAFDERFGGVLCGIFKYTDEYGREKMILAADGFWYIRAPYAVPTFAQSDAYPFDAFDRPVDSDPDPDKWRGSTSRYKETAEALEMKTGAAPGLEHENMPGWAMSWFKEQSSRSYKVRIQYTLPELSIDNSLFIVIKGQDDLSTGAALLAVLDQQADSVVKMSLYDRDAADNLSLIGEATTTGLTGFLQLEYNQATKIAKATLTPVGGALKSVSSESFSELRDLDWGQNCGIGIAKGAAGASVGNIEVVDGGPV
jgi:hypothetical protein